MTKIRALGVGLLGLLVLALSACGSLIKTDQQTQALWYEDGDFQAQTFKGCIGNAVRDRKGIGDNFYPYPLGDRTWSFTGRPGSDAGPITIKTSDSQEMNVLGFMQFTLIDTVDPNGNVIKENCDTLRTFHERIGLKYGAYFNEDGSASKGWDNFLNDYIAVPVNNVMDRGGMQNNVRALYANTKLVNSVVCDPAGKVPADCGAQDAFKVYVQNNVQAEIDRVLGVPGFIKVKLVATETPRPSDELLDSFKKVEQAKADAEAKTATANADLTTQAAKNRLAAQKYKEVAECVKVLGVDPCFRLKLQEGPNPPQYIPYGSQLHVDAKK